MYKDQDGVPLCEMPEGGQGYTRCKHVGFVPATGQDVCCKFAEEVSVTYEGWIARCPSCQRTNGYMPRDKR